MRELWLQDNSNKHWRQLSSLEKCWKRPLLTIHSLRMYPYAFEKNAKLIQYLQKQKIK
ncbi:hypothetical protein EMIT0194MI4_130131 [Pseudomonas sp. IT-194MI4]